jgi:hypothetical protein
MSLLIGSLISAYSFAGLISWLTTAVESTGELTPETYSYALKEFSRKGSLYEFIVSLYVFILWPVHLTLKKVTRQ